MSKGNLSLSEVDAMSESEMLAWTVALGEAEGGRFDFENMRWQEPER